MTRFRVDPERSTVWTEARSNVHPIHGEANGFAGYIEAGVTGGRLDPSTPVKGRVELPLTRFRSGNPLQDREMQRRIDAHRFPTVVCEAKEVKELESTGRYLFRGDLRFHGVTRPLETEVKVGFPDERSITVDGEERIDIRDFDLKPPRILMFRVLPEVKVRVQIVGAEED